jgi:hypothetical protein
MAAQAASTDEGDRTVRGTFRVAAIAVKLGAILVLAGCRFEVKDIGGLQAYVTDAECAKLRAIEMKAQFSDPKSTDYLRVRALYSEAMSQANSFVASVRRDVNIRNPMVDVPKMRYDQHKASARLAEFMKETSRLRAEYLAHQGEVLGKALEDAARQAVEQATADEKAAAGRLAAQTDVQGRLSELKKEYADLQTAFGELKATGQKQGTVTTEEYTARVVPEAYVPAVEQATEEAGALGQKALNLLAELQKDLRGRDEESQKRAGQRIEASEKILQAAADLATHSAEPVPDGSGLIMQGTRVAIPIVASIIQLNGEIARDGVSRFDSIMDRIQLPDFDSLAGGEGGAGSG